MAVRTKPTEEEITHHVSFEQGSTKLGLVLCNGRGEPDPKAFREGKMPNRAMQFSQGDPDYSDMELPYTPITQKNWSGGRGQEDFENDTTRYSDGNAIDALSGDLILGPKTTVTPLGSGTSGSLVNAQQDSERFPNGYTGARWSSNDLVLPDSQYFVWTNNFTRIWLGEEHVILMNGGILTFYDQIDRQSRATRFQWNQADSLTKIKLWLANTNNVTISILSAGSVDTSTSLAKAELVMKLVYPENYTPTRGDVTQTYSIVESATLTEYSFDFIANLVNGNYYWLVVTSNKPMYQPKDIDFTFDCVFGTNNTPSTYEIRYAGSDNKKHHSYDQNGGTSGIGYENHAGIINTNTGDSLAYELISEAVGKGTAFFFKLRHSEFVIKSPAEGGAPRLFMEGYHGYATSNNADKSRINITGIGSEAVGAIVKIVAGKGSTERVRWRMITLVTSTYCEVDRNWEIVHDNTTEYAIYGTGKWTEITGHGLTTTITDVCVVDDTVFFAQGEDVAIRRLTFYNSAQVWTAKYWTETAKASLLEMIQNEKGERKIWRALATSAKVSSSNVAAWADAADILSFGTEITCGNQMYRITNIIAYGTPRIPYILKEDGFGAISNAIYDQVPLTEFAAVSDDNNGRAVLQMGVYLYLSLLNGLERYYEGRLDDMGPNRDMGMPENRTGQIIKLLAYPGRMYAAIDHQTGYSSVMVYNNIGWHEIYRSSLGARIYSLHVQVLDGPRCDRLWVVHENDIAYMDIAVDPKKQITYPYTYASTGSIETSWISGNFKEIKKYYNSIEVFSEDLVAAQQYARISYKVDSDLNAWNEINVDVNSSPSQEIEFPNHNVSGKKIKLKITLYTNYNRKTPRIKGITIKPVTRLPIKNSWTLTYRVDDAQVDLQGTQSTLTAAQLQAQIKAWANSELSPLPLLMNVPHALFDNVYVFIEPESLRPISMVYNNKLKKFIGIGQLSVFEA